MICSSRSQSQGRISAPLCGLYSLSMCQLHVCLHCVPGAEIMPVRGQLLAQCKSGKMVEECPGDGPRQ